MNNPLHSSDIINALKQDTRPFDDGPFFAWLASRENDSQITKLDRAIRKTGMESSHVLAIFRDLEKHGIGRFIVGRKGHPSRFEWKYSLRSVGKAKLEDDVDLEELDFLNLDESDDFLEDDPSDLVYHSFVLRRDLTLSIGLPANLSTIEADRIAAFVKALPIS